MTSSIIVRRVALGALMALAAAGSARAEEGTFMKNMLGNMGIIPMERPRIDYRERAPLVVPPKAGLPAPAAGASARNAQWPNDPDVAARRRAAAEERIPVTESDKRRAGNDNPSLSIHEIRAGRVAGAGLSNEPVIRPGDNTRADIYLDPDTLRSKRRVEPEEEVGGEPARQALSDPPSGFRKPAGGAKLTRDWEAPRQEDEADPRAYLRQQQGRR